MPGTGLKGLEREALRARLQQLTATTEVVAIYVDGVRASEIKAGQTLSADYFSTLNRWRQWAGDVAHAIGRSDL